MITLKDVVPVASGLNQLVHQHPGDPNLLIKTLRPEKALRRFTRKIGGFRVKRRHGIYTGWFRELNEYLALRARTGSGHPPCLQQLHGFVETDLGLGFVVGKIKDRSGQLAPTLGQVVYGTGMTPELRAQILALRDWLNAHDVITNDLTKSNILCAWTPESGEHLVIIEGLGDHHFIRLSTISRTINHAGNNRHFRHIVSSLERVERVRLEQQKAKQA